MGFDDQLRMHHVCRLLVRRVAGVLGDFARYLGEVLQEFFLPRVQGLVLVCPVSRLLGQIELLVEDSEVDA